MLGPDSARGTEGVAPRFGMLALSICLIATLNKAAA